MSTLFPLFIFRYALFLKIIGAVSGARMNPIDDKTNMERLVLAHEYFRCDQAFLDFAELSIVNIGGKSEKRLRLKMFDAYSRFLHHLYEFYLGISKLHYNRKRATGGIDILIQDEVERIMRVRAERIRQGRAPRWENGLSYYEKTVPAEFAMHFRQTRNRIAHATAGRAGANGALTLPEFYHKYHRYVYLLYEEAEWLWKVNPENFEWGEIEEFDLAVHTETVKVPAVAKIVVRIRRWLLERQLLRAIRARR